MLKISGYYLDGKTSQRLSAELVLEPFEQICIYANEDIGEDIGEDIEENIEENSGNHISADIKKNQDPYGKRCLLKVAATRITIPARIGNTPRQINFPDGAQFVTDSDQLIEQLQARYHRRFFKLHKLESNLKLVVLSTVITVVFVAAGIVYGIPLLARTVAYQLPDKMLSKLSIDGIERLDKAVFLESQLDKAKQQQLRALMQPILDEFETSNPHLYFRSADEPNAFALPGGAIVFTDQMIDLITSDQQLLSILMHEIGHVQNRHIIRQVLQDSMLALLLVFISGDFGTIEKIMIAPKILAGFSYSRDFEREADVFAMETMIKHNIEPRHFGDGMKIIEAYFSDDESDQETKKQKINIDILSRYLATHPAPDERIKMSDEYQQRFLDLKEG